MILMGSGLLFICRLNIFSYPWCPKINLSTNLYSSLWFCAELSTQTLLNDWRHSWCTYDFFWWSTYDITSGVKANVWVLWLNSGFVVVRGVCKCLPLTRMNHTLLILATLGGGGAMICTFQLDKHSQLSRKAIWSLLVAGCVSFVTL